MQNINKQEAEKALDFLINSDKIKRFKDGTIQFLYGYTENDKPIVYQWDKEYLETRIQELKNVLAKDE